MGTWDMGAFDSDDARDWVIELEGVSDDSAVRAALDVARFDADEYVEAPDGQIALAAAEVVAAANGRPASEGLPTEVTAWVEAHGQEVRDLRTNAIAAIDRVLATTNSELRDLWSTEEGARPADIAEWESRVADLRERLRAGADV